jgi:hypothetical protein
VASIDNLTEPSEEKRRLGKPRRRWEDKFEADLTEKL